MRWFDWGRSVYETYEIIMLKYLLILTFLLSACTRQLVTPEEAMYDAERSKYMVYNILWPFLIDREKSPITTPLIEIQERCEGEDFVEYRECFLKGMQETQGSLIHNSQEQEFFEVFWHTLQREIEYYTYYQELDDMDYPEDEVFSLEEKDCYIVSTWWFRSEYMWTISEHSIPIVVSYNTNDRDSLIWAFPSWSSATIYDTKSFSWYGFDPDYPCMYRTFGPSYGNIVHTETIWDNLYIFIKVNEWAWSGEFYYSVFIYNLTSHTHTNIWWFWAWSGIIPFSYNLNMERQKTSLIEAYKNQPFLYYQVFENKRIHGDTVESVYLNSIQ